MANIKCKYKLFDNERFCQVIHGECQFIQCSYGEHCPIYDAYKDYDKYWLEQNAAAHGGVVSVDNILVQDAGEAETRALDIQIPQEDNI